MKVISAGYEIWKFPEKPLESIERAARTCYKSEDRICPGSAEALIKRLIESRHEAMIEFGGTAAVLFTVDRGVTHELVRHRIASFAQESTRYCNYSKGKFNSELTVIDPRPALELKLPGEENRPRRDAAWIAFDSSWAEAERAYLHLIDAGAPPEIARGVLPQALKAEINVEANLREWRHIFKLRTSKRAHPQLREVMVPLLAEFKHRAPIIFGDISGD